MKHIKLRIIVTIWCSAFLLLAVCEIILNVSVPRHFKKEAVSAIEEELIYAAELDEFVKKNTENFPEMPDTYFGSEIQYIPVRRLTFENPPDKDKTEESPSNSGTESVGSAENTSSSIKLPSFFKQKVPDKRIEKKELVDFVNKNKPERNKVLTLHTKTGNYIFATYTEYFPEEGDYLYIMYINLKYVLGYTRTLNFILILFYVAVSLVMSVPGAYLAKKIEESQKAQRRFFQNTSHELKTPLMTVQGYAEGIQTGITEPKKAAEVILQESDRMAQLVNELLSLSKIDLHSLKPNITRIDLREVLYDSLRAAEPLITRRGIKLTPELPDKPVWINADEDMLERVFMNILSNGVRHCKNEVKIICTPFSRFVTVRFRDDGNGISDEDLPHIFERFYTGENGSTGIGLALAQELVKLNGGTVSAYNDNGAVFMVKFFYAQYRPNN